MKYKNIDEAIAAIENEAARDAWEWLEREKPDTARAIRYLIEVARMSVGEVIEYLDDIYGDSEPRARHKMRLVIEALQREAV